MIELYCHKTDLFEREETLLDLIIERIWYGGHIELSGDRYLIIDRWGLAIEYGFEKEN